MFPLNGDTCIVLILLHLILAKAENTTLNVLTPVDAPEVGEDRARIIGGVPVRLGEVKYQLSLRYVGHHHCGASIIEVDKVQLAITAAHCVSRYQPEDITLVAGGYRLSERIGTEQTRQVAKIVLHDNFSNSNASLYANDIALLFYDEPFLVNDFVASIPLPEPFSEPKGVLLASGWGVYNADGFISDNLTKLEVPIVDFEMCKKSYANLVKGFHKHFLCAGGGVNKDTCKGDSGGPVRSLEEGYLAGIISWGAGCGYPKYPGVNMKVSFFVDWINDQVKTHKESKDEDDESDEDNTR